MASAPENIDSICSVKSDSDVDFLVGSASSASGEHSSSRYSADLIIENMDGDFDEMDLNKRNVVVRNMIGATFYLNGSPKFLKLSRLTDCKLICGPILKSALIEECNNCVFFICCQQFKAKSCESLDIYLRVGSKAVISDCTSIGFAPYKWNHARSSELHALAEFDQTKERFDLIDDIDWLAFSTPSPNWVIIPEEERVEFPEAQLPEDLETARCAAQPESAPDGDIQFNPDAGAPTEEASPKRQLQKVSSIPLY